MNSISTSKSRIQVGFKGLATDTDEAVMDFAYSPRAVNFTFRDGVLKSDFGIEPAAGRYPGSMENFHRYYSFIEGIELTDVFPYFRRGVSGAYDDRIVVRTSSGKLYQTRIFKHENWTEITGYVSTGKISAVNYNYRGDDVLLISSDTAPLAILNDATVTEIDTAPKFTSLTVHYERVFGAVNGAENQVWFSDDFNPDNWTVDASGAGFIGFADECGDVIKVVSFLNYLYIFREHGIFRLTAYGDQSEFSLKKVFTDTGRIFKDTIAPCGDRIIFLAEEGLFSFDGYNVSKIANEFPGIQAPDTAVGAYANGRYYLGCYTSVPEFVPGIEFNNTLLEYDIRKKSVCMLAVADVKKLVPCNVHQSTELLILFNSGATHRVGMIGSKGRIMETPTEKYYYSPLSNLGTGRDKIIRDITFTTKTAVTLTVITDGREYEYSLEGGESPQTIFVGKSGKKIGFKIKCVSQNAYITPLIVNLEAL